MEERHIRMDSSYSWLVCMVGFFANTITFGLFNSFGSLYVVIMDEFGVSGEQAAWVGSISYSVTLFAGAFTGPLSVQLGFRPVCFAGACMASLGLLLSSFASNVMTLYLTYGILFGCGCSGVYFSSILVLPFYFDKRLSFSIAVSSAGVGMGPLVFGPLCDILSSKIGLRNYIRVLSALFVVMAMLSFVYGTIRTRETGLKPPKRSRKFEVIDISLLRNPAFLYWTGTFCLVFFVYYVPYVHLVKLAMDLEVPSTQASLLLGYMSITQTLGRLFFGKMADHPGCNRLQIFQISLLGMSVANTLCPMSNSFAGLVAYCCAFGFFEGAFAGMVFLLTGDIFGRRRLHTAIGTLYCLSSPFSIVGPPVAGYLYAISNSYDVPFFVAGAALSVAAALLFLLPWMISSRPEDHKTVVVFNVSEEKPTIEISCRKSLISHNTDISSDSGIGAGQTDNEWNVTLYADEPEDIRGMAVSVEVEEESRGQTGGSLLSVYDRYLTVPRHVANADEMYRSLASSMKNLAEPRTIIEDIVTSV